MDCGKAYDYINLYIDGIIGAEEQKELLAHIKTCRKCGKEFKNAVRLKKALHGLKEKEPPYGLADSAIKKAKKRIFPAFYYYAAGLAAAAALVLALSSSLIQNEGAGNAERNIAAAPMPAPSAASDNQFSDTGAESFALMATQSSADRSQIDICDTTKSASSPALRYVVPSGKEDSVNSALWEFLNGSGIPAVLESKDGENTISFTITEQYLSKLADIADSYGIAHDGQPCAGDTIQFVFTG